MIRTVEEGGADETAGARVLVVDDDPTVADVVARYLRRDGYGVECVEDGVAALRRFAAVDVHLVILDLLLPGLGGLEVCRRMRAHRTVPIVMLTALGEETDRVVGLEVGADDYVTKPFSPRELALRVRSVLRRASAPPSADPSRPTLLRDGDLLVDLAAREVTLGGTAVSLTAREYDLLVHLMRHPRQAFTRRDLLEQVWQWSFGDMSTVTVHARRLREKIESDPTAPQRIVTVWGVGYRYESLDAT